MITQGHILTTTKAVPEYPRRHELFSSLYCNVFLGSTPHCDGEPIREDLDLLYEVPNQLLIVSEHLSLCLIDCFP